MIDRRRANRRPTTQIASIAFDRRDVRLCMVRDISNTGACLQLQTIANVPDSFDLLRDGNAYVCQVMWRANDRLGVRFDLSDFMAGELRTSEN